MCETGRAGAVGKKEGKKHRQHSEKEGASRGKGRAGTQAWAKRFPKIRPVFVRRTITRSVYCCQDELAHRLIYRTNPVAQTIRCTALKGLIRRFWQI